MATETERTKPGFSNAAILGAVSACIAQTVVGTPLERQQILTKIARPPTDPLVIDRNTNPYRFYWRENHKYLIKHVPLLALDFGFYQTLSNIFRYKDGHAWGPGLFIAGGAAGAASLVITYPLRSIQSQLAFSSSIIAAVWRAYRSPGSGFIKNVQHAAIPHAVFNSLYFGLYETIKPKVLRSRWWDNIFGRMVFACATTYAATVASRPLFYISHLITGKIDHKPFVPADTPVLRSWQLAGSHAVKHMGVTLFVWRTPRTHVATAAVALALYDTIRGLLYRQQME